jgi:hypothetical protein
MWETQITLKLEDSTPSYAGMYTCHRELRPDTNTRKNSTNQGHILFSNYACMCIKTEAVHYDTTDLIRKSYKEKQYAKFTALSYMLRKNRSVPTNPTENAKYINTFK